MPTLILKQDLELSIKLKEYRKQTRMPQWVLGEIVGVSDKTISNIELALPVSSEIKDLVKHYLANAPKPRKVRKVGERPNNIYLTTKLLTWAKITNMPVEGLEAIRALKETYDRAKLEQGLAHIPLIQLEVENALTLATRGHYKQLHTKAV